MKKILILTNNSMGLYRFRKELIEALITNGNKVIVSSPVDEFTDRLISLGITYIGTKVDRRGTNPLQDYSLYRNYCTILRKIKPDIILTYTIKPNIYGNLAACRLNIPVISTVTGLGDSFLFGGVVSRLTDILYRWAFRKTFCVLFENGEDVEILRRKGIIKNQKAVCVPGAGVNLKEYDVLDYLEDLTVSFLYIGRVMRSKGVIELIAAARKLKSEPLDFTLMIIGFSEGDIEQELGQAEQEGIITIAGFQENVVPFIKDAHCIVLPSYKEGMSNVLLEAAACGRPLITTDVSGCREAVDDGVNGFICKPKSADSLYNCMKRFLGLSQEQRIEMGLASRKKVKKEFNRDIVVNLMITEIERLTIKRGQRK
jgi:galacturonosyltransferase